MTRLTSAYRFFMAEFACMIVQQGTRGMKVLTRREGADTAAAIVVAALTASCGASSDPNPLDNAGLILGAFVLVLCAGLATLHQYLAYGLAAVAAIPVFNGLVLSLWYLGTPATPGSLLFLAAVALYAWATYWRINKDWSK